MWWFDLIWAFLLAWVFVYLLTGPLRWRHPSRADAPVGVAAVFLFFIFFLAIWAGGVWLVPFGPTIAGAYWLPFVLVGLFILLLFAAAAGTTAPPPPRTSAEAQEEVEEAAAAGAVITVFFWALMIGLLIAIILGYVID
jgi:hypothetical protein